MARGARGVSAFLVYSDDNAYQRTYSLDDAADRVRIGRGTDADVRLAWDREVSRVHAELQRLGEGWALSDDGLSANGTYVNGERLRGRRRLASGDEIRVGKTGIVFRALSAAGSSTFVPTVDVRPVELSRMQRRVLIALCRPFKEATGYVTPATNQHVADELFLSVDAVKAHMRHLFDRFELGDLPQNEKRQQLVAVVLGSGLLARHEF